MKLVHMFVASCSMLACASAFTAPSSSRRVWVSSPGQFGASTSSGSSSIITDVGGSMRPQKKKGGEIKLRMMKTPGFKIKNETIWPIQVSLGQVGPLYWGVVKPGETFRRDTGAVWFTVKAVVVPDGKETINVWKDSVLPVGAIAVAALATAATAGLAAGPAATSMTGAAATAGATGFGASASAAINTSLASALVGAGLPAGAAITAGTAASAGVSSAAGALLTKELMGDIFGNSDFVSVSKGGVYAGAPWPFRGTVRTYRVTGGPKFKKGANPNEAVPYGTKLVLK